MINNRKKDHIHICSEEDVEVSKDYWDDIKLYHRAAPEVNFEDIDMGVEFLGKELSAPLMIAGITGGYEEGKEINRRLASAADRLNIGFGVGSQRAGLENEDLKETYSVVKEYEPPLVVGNVGAPQLISQGGEEPIGFERCKEALDMIDGDYIAVHFNYLQEIVQPEGDLRAENVLSSLRKLTKELPIIAKETGAGVSKEIAVGLEKAGVEAIDVGGMGGTSFSAVEQFRTEDRKSETLARKLREWGIPTPVSLVECREAVSLPLIGTGGIQDGIQAVKALSLGADIVGIAGGVLSAALKSQDEVIDYLQGVIEQMRSTMFLMGCERVNQIPDRRKTIIGETRDWLDS